MIEGAMGHYPRNQLEGMCGHGGGDSEQLPWGAGTTHGGNGSRRDPLNKKNTLLKG